MTRIAVLVLCLAAPASSVWSQAVHSIEGRWFGALKSPEGDRHCWVSDRREDGTYKTDFLTENAGTFERYTEAGRWTQSANSFLTVVQTKNGAPIPERRVEYGIVMLTSERLSYLHIQSGTQFTTRRVTPDFHLPEACGIR